MTAGRLPSAETEAHAGQDADLARRPPPFLLVDGQGDRRRVIVLEASRERLTIGRRSALDVPLSWDEEVSRVHAELVRVGGEWTLVDDGLSANGSFINGERLRGRQRLRDGDVLRFGGTSVVFRQGRATSTVATAGSTDAPGPPSVTDAQRRILVALRRPFKDNPAFSTPATNEQIAREVFLSADAVKKHLRVLSVRFGVGALPQNEKRLRLAERALSTGTISHSQL